MSPELRWPASTNKGTALLKLLHQRLPHPLFRDEFLQWFVDGASFSDNLSMDSLASPVHVPEKEFQRVAFWYAGLRERFFDDLIRESIEAGSTQLLLLGAGFDTRYLRLKGLARSSVQTYEVDLERTIAEKRRILEQRLGRIPPNLHLLPLDFNRRSLSELFENRLNGRSPAVCIWQGVSYYLPEETVLSVLRFMSRSLSPGSTIGFDCCSPLMLTDNEQVPGIQFNIRQLKMKAEPYVFGMDSESMEGWLQELGFTNIRSVDQRGLEKRYRPGIGLPDKMWYCVSAKTASEHAL